MGKRTGKEHERNYKRGRARDFFRWQQIVSSPDFDERHKRLRELWSAYQESSHNWMEIQHTLTSTFDGARPKDKRQEDERDHLWSLLDDWLIAMKSNKSGAAALGLTIAEINNMLALNPRAAVWLGEWFFRYPEARQWEGASGIPPLKVKAPAVWRMLIEYPKHQTTFLETKRAYESEWGDFVRDFGLLMVPGLERGATLDDLRKINFKRFLSIPGIFKDEEPVNIIPPHPSKADPPDSHPTRLYSGKYLLMAVNMDRPLGELLAATQGTLRSAVEDLHRKSVRRLRSQVETRRTKVRFLYGKGITAPRRIAEQIDPHLMKSDDAGAKKRFLQMVKDDLRLPRRVPVK
jgi:hypothetical protein